MLPEAELTRLRQRYREVDEEFRQYEPDLRRIAAMMAPHLAVFEPSSRGRNRVPTGPVAGRVPLLDNTALRDRSTLGAGMLAGASSPARPWFRILPRDPEMRSWHSVREWTDHAADVVRSVFAASNLYRALQVAYESFVFGTAAIGLVDDEETVVRAQTKGFFCGEYRLFADSTDRVTSIFRRFAMSALSMVETFGKEAVSSQVQEVLRTRPGAMFPVVHVIEPRAARDVLSPLSINAPFASIYYEEAPNEVGRVLRVSGFDEFPVLTPRWGPSAFGPYGYGPGHVALGDCSQLQQQQFAKGQGIAFMALPAMQGPEALRDQAHNLVPGGVSYTPGGELRAAFQPTLRLDHLLGDIQDVRERIHAAFFADVFRLLSLRSAQPGSRTATEVAELHEEKLIQLGPVLESVHTELLSPLVRRVFRAAQARGMIRPVPAELRGQPLDLEFISTLAQAQRAVGVTSIERALAVAGAVAEVKPEIFDNLDPDGLWTELSMALGTPARLSVDPKLRDELRESRHAAQAQAAQAELAGQQATAARDLAAVPAARPGSVTTPSQGTALSDVFSLFSGFSQPPASAV